MEIRPATVDDYDAYARLFVELGIDDPVPDRERFAADLLSRVTIAAEGDDVLGYAMSEVLATTGYVRNIVTDPARRRRGVGRALMTWLRARFVAAGATTWCLNVKPDNVAAIALYERCGLRAAYRSHVVRVGPSVALEAPPSLVVSDVPPVSDAAVERQFGLLAGQLASARDKGSRRPVQLVRGTEVVGVGVFAVAIPGAFPFRVADPSLAGSFLARLRELAPPRAAYVQVGIEDDATLRDEVLRLGGYLVLEIVHMTGALP